MHPGLFSKGKSFRTRLTLCLSTSRDCLPDVDLMPDCSWLPLSLLCTSQWSLLCLWCLTSQLFPGLSMCFVTQSCWVAAWPSYVQLNPGPCKRVFLITSTGYRIAAPWAATGTTEVESTRCLPQRRAGGTAMPGLLQSLQSSGSVLQSWVTNQRVGRNHHRSPELFLYVCPRPFKPH